MQAILNQGGLIASLNGEAEEAGGQQHQQMKQSMA